MKFVNLFIEISMDSVGVAYLSVWKKLRILEINLMISINIIIRCILWCGLLVASLQAVAADGNWNVFQAVL